MAISMKKLRRPASPEAADANAAAASGDGGSLARAARLELLAQISEFVDRHDLDVTAANLALVCNALSGASRELAELFARREMSGEPIDQRWLDMIYRLDPEMSARLEQLDRVMDALESSVARFAQATQTTKDAASDHRGAIGAQIDAMAKLCGDEDPASEIEKVISLSRSMLERIEQAERAMERSQAESEELRANLARARMEADVDFLTGLPNRRAFERRLNLAVEKARKTGEKLCVAFCDIDHFKAINDKHGHDAGDRVLCMIAQILAGHASDHCFVSRHGGEEFVMLFYGFDKQQALQKLDRIRCALAMKHLTNRENGKPFGKITFSAGIAEVTEDVDPRSALVRADAALYEAKETGRNRIVVI